MVLAVAWAAPRLTPRMALAPRRPLLGVPSRSISVRSRPPWSSTLWPSTAAAISPSTLAIALSTPLPPNRSWSPSRSSTASWAPVLAPEGTIAVPESASVSTVTARVGLPRESRTSSALTASIWTTTRILVDSGARCSMTPQNPVRGRAAAPSPPPRFRTAGASRALPALAKGTAGASRALLRPATAAGQELLGGGAEAVVEQPGGVGEEDVGVHHHRHQVAAVAGRRDHDAATGIVGEAGLEPGRSGIRPEHLVEVVGRVRVVLRGGRDRPLPGPRDLHQRRVLGDQVGGDHGQVVGRRSQPGVIQAAGVAEGGAPQAPAGGPGVHVGDEAAPGHDRLPERFGGVVA